MGTLAAPRLTDWRTALRLGRVSNLPTVWTNVLAGMVVVGGPGRGGLYLVTGLAMSFLYLGGMWLNDAFDREVDAIERPSRPIPAGEIDARSVFFVGFALLAVGVVLLALVSSNAGLAGLGLAAAIVAYDWFHKQNPLSPAVMGLCRALVYIGAGLALVSVIPRDLAMAGLAILVYVLGLTFVAKQENLEQIEHLWPVAFLAWPFLWLAPSLLGRPIAMLLWAGFLAWVVAAVVLLRRRPARAVPRAVVRLIAGISLLDGVIVAAFGAPWLGLLCLLGFAATLLLQRWVAGT